MGNTFLTQTGACPLATANHKTVVNRVVSPVCVSITQIMSVCQSHRPKRPALCAPDVLHNEHMCPARARARVCVCVSQDKLKDKLGMLEHRASLLLRLGRTKEAEEQYRALVASNPDHYRYHEQLQVRSTHTHTHTQHSTALMSQMRVAMGLCVCVCVFAGVSGSACVSRQAPHTGSASTAQVTV